MEEQSKQSEQNAQSDQTDFDPAQLIKPTFSEQDTKLYELVYKFILEIIMDHETKFFNVFDTQFPHLLEEMLNEPNPIINNMIQVAIEKYFNNFYFEYQLMFENKLFDRKFINKFESIKLISEITKNSKSTIIEQLFRLTIDIHFKLDRTELKFDTLENYLESVSKQFETVIFSSNVLPIMNTFTDHITDFIITTNKVFKIDIV